jgi:predicted glycosyl hydrolase (DUF1957 family)
MMKYIPLMSMNKLLDISLILQHFHALPQTAEKVSHAATEVKVQEFRKPSSTSIASKHTPEAHKTLGAWKSMNGDGVEEIKVLEKHSKITGSIITTSGMFPYQTHDVP